MYHFKLKTITKGILNLHTSLLHDITTTTIVSFCQRTPLHLAAREGRENTVKCLVKHGAAICVMDNYGVQNVTTDDVM